MRPSGTPPFWDNGTVVYWCAGRAPQPGWVKGQASQPEFVDPMFVIQDDSNALVAWLPEGTPLLSQRGPHGVPMRDGPAEHQFAGPRIPVLTTWRGPGVIRVAPTGSPWSAWLFRDPSGDVAGWYINLERPHVRDETCVFSRDHVLDIWVPRDGHPRRKDEDELERAIEQGWFTHPEAEQIERHAVAAERAVAAWGSPFCDGWEHWTPDAAWGTPQLPAEVSWELDCTVE